MIKLSSPQITDGDIEVVVEILKSGQLSIGKYTLLFEEIVANYVGSKYSVAVSSGTSALHLILKSLNVSSGDILFVPSFTFIASANVGVFEGMEIKFIDIEDETYNMDLNHLEYVLKHSDKNKKKFLMAVDVFGHPLDWDNVLKICEKHDVTVIEDSCEALGSSYKGKKCGTFGVAGAFAFYPNKQITTGEGGIIVTDDENIAKLSKALRNQGRGEGSSWLSHTYLGYNYRIDELSAGLGYSQMKRIDNIVEKRNEVADRYRALLKDSAIKCPVVKDYTTTMSWFVYVVTLDEKIDRDSVLNYIISKEVQVRDYFAPVHLQTPYRKLGWKEGDLPVTENISKRTLALPFYTDLEYDSQRIVSEVLKEAIEKVG